LGQNGVDVLPEVQSLAGVDSVQLVRGQQVDQGDQSDPHLIE
jgi:hypothetical protein